MNILLAEDDALLADALTAQLRGAGFEVEHAANGAVADYLLGRQKFDLAILDIGLPLVDGLSVLRTLRRTQAGLPVVMLTARDSLADRVAGLQAGADDYVTKPFDFPELEARLHALLRRTQPATGAVQLGGLVLDRDAHRATLAGEVIELSGREWTLLELLADKRGEVVTKEQIVQAWTGDDDTAGATASAGAGPGGNGNAIEVYIHRLRRKLDGSALTIRTARGLGYLLEVGVARAVAP